MEHYTFLRELADSWGLLTLTMIFVGVIAFAFRPGSRALHRDIANIPLRNDTLEDPGCTGCTGACAAKIVKDF